MCSACLINEWQEQKNSSSRNRITIREKSSSSFVLTSVVHKKCHLHFIQFVLCLALFLFISTELYAARGNGTATSIKSLWSVMCCCLSVLSVQGRVCSCHHLLVMQCKIENMFTAIHSTQLSPATRILPLNDTHAGIASINICIRT